MDGLDVPAGAACRFANRHRAGTAQGFEQVQTVAGNRPHYAVAHDGRFLINEPVGDATAAPITLSLNWQPPPATKQRWLADGSSYVAKCLSTAHWGLRVGRFCYAVRMTLDAVKRCLLEQRALLLEHGVSALYVFGSVVHGRATAQSDIDLLVEFSRPIGLVAFVRLQQRLATVLGHPVDLVTPAALKPQLRARILREAVRAA